MILSVSRGIIGKKAQMDSGHKETELEAVQTFENLWRPLQQTGKESKRATEDMFKLFEEWNDRCG